MSSIIASEFNHRPNMFVGYGCSNATLEAIEAMEPDREWLYNLQVRAGIDAPLGVDIRLSGKIVMFVMSVIRSYSNWLPTCTFSNRLFKRRHSSICIASFLTEEHESISVHM